MLPNNILPDEDLTDLCINHWKVLQKKQGFRFSIDSILLAHFVQPQTGQQLLDLGTGCAIIPLLLTAYHQQLQIEGIELQADIADMAKRSVLYNHLQEKIIIHQQDFTKLSLQFHQKYDWVISNPPFFPIGKGKQNPNKQIALARHEIACTLEQLMQCSARYLKSRGHFAMIHRAERLTEILTYCQQYHLAPIKLRLVHSTSQQPANLVLLEAILNGHNTLTVLPPLFIYQKENIYSSEVQSYFNNQ